MLVNLVYPKSVTATVLGISSPDLVRRKKPTGSWELVLINSAAHSGLTFLLTGSGLRGRRHLQMKELYLKNRVGSLLVIVLIAIMFFGLMPALWAAIGTAVVWGTYIFYSSKWDMEDALD